MKATIVFIADNDAENYGRKLMLKANRHGKMGFEMARLPQHVSLKQPFAIRFVIYNTTAGCDVLECIFSKFTKPF